MDIFGFAHPERLAPGATVVVAGRHPGEMVPAAEILVEDHHQPAVLHHGNGGVAIVHQRIVGDQLGLAHVLPRSPERTSITRPSSSFRWRGYILPGRPPAACPASSCRFRERPRADRTRLQGPHRRDSGLVSGLDCHWPLMLPPAGDRPRQRRDRRFDIRPPRLGLPAWRIRFRSRRSIRPTGTRTRRRENGFRRSRRPWRASFCPTRIGVTHDSARLVLSLTTTTSVAARSCRRRGSKAWARPAKSRRTSMIAWRRSSSPGSWIFSGMRPLPVFVPPGYFRFRRGPAAHRRGPANLQIAPPLGRRTPA